MITIIVQFTKAEQQEIDVLESRYEKLYRELDAILDGRDDAELNAACNSLFEGLDPESVEYHAAWEKEQELLTKWHESAPPEWKAALEEKNKAISKQAEERSNLMKRCEHRQFNELNGDLKTILQDAKSQARQLLYNSHQYHTGADLPEGSIVYNERYVSQATRLLNATAAREMIYRALQLHIDELQKDEKLFDEFTGFIDQLVRRSEVVDKQSAEEMPDELPAFVKAVVAVATKYPISYITPTDKVNNLAFSGELNGSQLQAIAMERRNSKNKITTLVSVDIDQLQNVKIQGRTALAPYDREVHDAIVTLYAVGGNEYITPQMIYQVMTGNPNAFLEKKQAQAISDSITKCLYSEVTINADVEAKAYGYDSFKYKGYLVNGERATVTLNGTVLECLHILRKLILYEYAAMKNQIGRFDISLLNSPLNKNEETVMLQGYLSRRILSMKGSSVISKTIVYETVYNQIEVSAATPGALRKKKTVVRKKIKNILDYWKEQGFIAGYVENTRKTESYSVTVRLKNEE